MSTLTDNREKWDKIVRMSGALKGSSSKVGFPVEAPSSAELKRDEDGNTTSATVVEVATFNEFGTPGAKYPIPARPALRSTTDRFASMVRKLKQRALNNLFDMVDSGGTVTTKDVKRELGVVGGYLASKIQLAIRDWKSPPNALRTQVKKGAKVGKGVLVDNPLYDTGQEVQSVTHVETA